MSKIVFTEGSAPPAPSTNQAVLYVKSDGFFYSKDDAGTETALSNVGSTDEKVKVSATDTTADYLANKVVAGTNITKSILNGGANEQVSWSAADPTVKISSGDTTAARLESKLVAGSNITITKNNAGGNETLTIASSTGSAFDPTTTANIYEEFITGNEDADELGTYGWRIFNNGTGTLPTRIDGVSGRPGIIRLNSGTTASTRSCISLGDSTALNSLVVGGGQIIFETSVRLIGTLTLFSRAQFGLGDTPNTNGAQANGVYFEFNPGGAETQFRIVSSAAGVSTRNNTSQTVVSGTWYRLRLTINAAGTSIQASINGVDVGSPITTNIPSLAISPLLKLDGLVGGVAVTADIDYLTMTQSGLSR